jgi:hypothetical protein
MFSQISHLNNTQYACFKTSKLNLLTKFLEIRVEKLENSTLNYYKILENFK